MSIRKALAARLAHRTSGPAPPASPVVSSNDSPWAGTRAVEAALPRDARGERLRRLRLAVGHEDGPGRAPHAGEPAQHLARVGVPGEALEVPDLGQHRHLALVDPHRARAVEQRAAERPHRLVAGDQQRVLGVGQALPAVVQDAAAGQHAARGDDDRRALHLVEGLRLRARAVELDPLAVEQAAAPDAVEAHLRALGVGGVDARGVDRHRAVDVDREGAHPARGHELVHQEDHLLGAAHGEGGDQEHPAAGEGLLEDALELVEHRQRRRACGCRRCSRSPGSRRRARARGPSSARRRSGPRRR